MIYLDQLVARWHQALRWNSLLFIVSQCGKTISSWMLFTRLLSSDYIALANVQSIVYLSILLLDFGLSRAIPQYCLSFSHNSKLKKQFVRFLIIGKLCLTLIGAIVGVALLSFICPGEISTLSLHKLIALGSLLFIGESTRSLLRLIFYAYLWHKRYNMLESVIILIRTMSMICLPLFFYNPSHIIYGILIIEISASILIVLGSICLLPKLLNDKSYQGQQTLNGSTLTRSFFTHTITLWGTTSINSLSERNVLVPFFSLVGGSAVASVFKVANDMALLLQRFVLKTIGTTDTTLFAHYQTKNIINVDNDYCIPSELWQRFNKKLLLLTLPLCGLVLFIFLQKQNNNITTLFCLLSLCYLGQLMLVGYRRILEVAHEYRLLCYSMIPYLGLIVLFFALYKNYILLTIHTLIPILVIIHGIRFTSGFIRFYTLRAVTFTSYPIKYGLKATFIVLFSIFFIHGACLYTKYPLMSRVIKHIAYIKHSFLPHIA